MNEVSKHNGPLAGFRVLELGSTVAGPFCGRLLADFGAEVIKVEPPEGDAGRTMGQHFEGKSLYATSIQRNKSLVVIDLRKAAGQELVRKLAAACDVLVENFRPGALEGWGLGYETLSRDNPGLVMVRISGFGQTGPYSQRPGYGVIGEAVSGLRHITGDPDRPPARAATSLTDYITGLYAAFGAVMALMERARTGRGQVVDAALYECAFSFMEPHIAAYEKLGHIANRAGSTLPGSTPNNLYPTRDGAFIHITAMADPVFRRLAAAMGRPELAEHARFATSLARNTNGAALDEVIRGWTTTRDMAEIELILQEAQVPATRIFTMADIFNDPHYRARGMLVSVPDDELGTVTMSEVVPRLSDAPGRIRSAGGRVGRDTDRVLREMLDLDSDELDRLRSEGVIAGDPVQAEPSRAAHAEGSAECP